MRPPTPAVVRTVDVSVTGEFLPSMDDNYFSHRHAGPSPLRYCCAVRDHCRHVCNCHRFVRDRSSPQGEISPGARPKGCPRHSGRTGGNPIHRSVARSGVADLGMSRTLQAFRSPIDDEASASELRKALTERFGSLGWVLEGVIQSISIGSIDSATRMWGDEAIDLLWDRGLLVSPDGNANHRGVMLVEEAWAWASARRAELLMTTSPPRDGLHRLEHLAVNTSPVERHGRRFRMNAVLASARQ